MRSSPSKISLNTSSTSPTSLLGHSLRNERESKTSRGGPGSGRATLKLTSHGQKNPFSVIIGCRYVQAMRLHGKLLTLSVDNKRWGLIRMVEVTRNALTFMVLSSLLLCHLQNAHSAPLSLMQFSTLPIHPLLCELPQKKIMTIQNPLCMFGIRK